MKRRPAPAGWPAVFLAAMLFVAMMLGACAGDEQPAVSSSLNTGSTEAVTTTIPSFDPAGFSTTFSNEYFPLPASAIYMYEGTNEAGPIRRQIAISGQTKVVMGVECSIVNTDFFVGQEVRQKTAVWYAEDGEGNVWCFGKEVEEYEGSEVVSTAGSWEAGVGGAMPGIAMKANPQVGDVYREEYVDGEIETMAEVVAVGLSVEVPYRSYEGIVLKTKNWSPLVPGLIEERYYAAGAGLIMVKQVQGGSAVEELTYVGFL